MTTKDTQRAKVYKAEREAFEHSVHWARTSGDRHALRGTHPKYSAPLPEVRDVERFVKRVFKLKRLANKYRLPKYVAVHDGRGCRSALSGGGEIKIPLWARTEWVVLHELAHEIKRVQDYNSEMRGDHRHAKTTSIQAHGWLFCRIYLDLVKYVLGREAHDCLKAAFKRNRVRFTPPRKPRELTPEQRAVLVERMHKARAARASAAAAVNEIRSQTQGETHA